MKTFIKTMKALSDPNRVLILKLLEISPLCVCEIQELFGLAQSTISKHMKILEDSDLVVSQREGSWIIYSLQNAPDNPHVSYFSDYLSTILSTDSKLLQMKQKLPLLTRRPQQN